MQGRWLCLRGRGRGGSSLPLILMPLARLPINPALLPCPLPEQSLGLRTHRFESALCRRGGPAGRRVGAGEGWDRPVSDGSAEQLGTAEGHPFLSRRDAATGDH